MDRQELATLIGILGFVLGGAIFGLGAKQIWIENTETRYKNRLISCELAEYRVDPKTGETSFVIFAEGN